LLPATQPYIKNVTIKKLMIDFMVTP